MVLIPYDAGIRMRMQTEAALHPVLPVPEIPADLADLRPGSTFSARIQEVLPENTYKALVAGRSLTLALPEGAKAGDTLELVVIDRTPRLIVAQISNRPATNEAQAASGNEFTNLSRTAQVIGSLLTRDGAPPPPVALTRGQPLLPAVGADNTRLAADLAPQLARAVSQSGVFYEAHQVQWVMGQRPLSDLQAEPQAQHLSIARPATAAGNEAAPTQITSGGKAAEISGPMVLLQNLFGGDDAREAVAPMPAALSAPAGEIPEELRPLVQQQLDAAATQRLAWHGEVWPGQSMNWQIEPDTGRGRGDAGDPERGWITSLRLVTPRLGEIDARLGLGSKGVAISILAPDPGAATDLRDSAGSLEKSMAAAGVPLLSLQVRQDAKE